MNKFIKYLLITVTVCAPMAANAAKSSKKKRGPHKVAMVKKNKTNSPARNSASTDTHTRIAALEAKISKLETDSVKVSKKDLAEGNLPKPFAASNFPKSSVKVGGQINRFVAYRDNGKNSRIEHLDSTASSSRLNITGTSNINPKLQVQGVVETELTDGVQSFSSDSDIGSAPEGAAFSNNSTSGAILRNRRLEAVFKHDKFGTLYIGKGHTASDGTSEVDYSGTNAISNASEAANNVGGFRFYNKNLRTSVGQRVASDAIRNMDGLQRANRVRYDTPAVAGIVLGFTHTNKDQSDQSIKYAATFGKTKVGAAIAHSYQPFNANRRHTYNGSFSIYNAGFSLAVAAGLDDFTVKNTRINGKRKHANFWFVKLGYQTKLINCGVTALAIDFIQANAMALTGSSATLLTGASAYRIVSHEQAKSFGLTIVQNFDSAGTEIYFSARKYQFHQPLATFDDAYVITVGSRVKF